MTKRLILAMFAWLFAATCTCAQTAASKPLALAEQEEISTLAGQLSDPQRDARTRQEAAAILLNRSHPRAEEILLSFLSNPANPQAQIAIADAIAKKGDGCSTAFVSPLAKMLTEGDPLVLASAARALAAWRNENVTAKLIALAGDRKQAASTRLAAVAAMDRVFTKASAATLVELTQDADDTLAKAASESLGRLTGIRANGGYRTRWAEWWAQNKDKSQVDWLTDLSESQAAVNASLDAENERLRKRLAETIQALYTSTPAAQRDAMLLGILKDSLADLRLAGAKIVELNLANNVEISKDVRFQIRSMLTDTDNKVRSACASLTATLADPDSVTVLLDRLKLEECSPVRLAILKALGQLQDARALPAVLAELQSRSEDSAAAALAAMAKIAGSKPLAGTQRNQAIKALLERYGRAGADVSESMRESLLKAMGAVGDKEFLPLLREALKDSAATIRLAAVEGLKNFSPDDVNPDLNKMLSDGDRGVRQAAIIAVSRLGGLASLNLLLRQTDPAVEQDSSVRQQAWDEVMGALAKADDKTLREVLRVLNDRKDSAAQKIRVLQMLAASLKNQDSHETPSVQRELGQTLARAERYSEAAPVLGEAYARLAAVKDANARAAWSEWVNVMLAADEPGVIKAMAEQADQVAFAEAMKSLESHLGDLKTRGAWFSLVQLGGEALKLLPRRMTPDQREALEQQTVSAKQRMQQADRQKTLQLVKQLLAANDSARQTAQAELQTLGDRALPALLEELRKAAGDAQGGAETEKAILGILRTIAPRLVGYDLSAARAERIKRVDAWVQELASGGN